MTVFFACLIACISIAGFVTIWFTTAYAELSAKRDSLADLDEQLHLHERLYSHAQDDVDARYANGMVETSRMLCREASKSYNRILRKPMNRIPGFLMGFREVDEDN